MMLAIHLLFLKTSFYISFSVGVCMCICMSVHICMCMYMSCLCVCLSCLCVYTCHACVFACHACVYVCVHVMLLCVCRSEQELVLSIMWVPVIELVLSGLAASAFTMGPFRQLCLFLALSKYLELDAKYK